LLFTGVNAVCLAMTLALTPMLTYSVSMNCSSIISPAAILVFFIVIIGALLSYPIKADYKRMKVALRLDGTDLALSDEESPKERIPEDEEDRRAVVDVDVEEEVEITGIELVQEEGSSTANSELQFSKLEQI